MTDAFRLSPPDQNGWIIARLGIRNPAGLVLGHFIAELGLDDESLMPDPGVSRDVIARLTDPRGIDPTVASQDLERLVEAILQDRRKYACLNSRSDRGDPETAERRFREALMLLAHYRADEGGEGGVGRDFARIAPGVPREVYRGAMWLLGEAILGSEGIPAPRELRRLAEDIPEASFSSVLRQRQDRTWALRAKLWSTVLRRDWHAEALANLSKHPLAERFLVPRVDELLAQGHLRDALLALIEEFWKWRDWDLGDRDAGG